jgi:hypothetical protein
MDNHQSMIDLSVFAPPGARQTNAPPNFQCGRAHHEENKQVTGEDQGKS